MNTSCFECGQEAQHQHHVVPRVKGGTKTVPLCTDCHAKVHDRKSMAHPELTRLGMLRAKARGVKFGTSRNLTREGARRGAVNAGIKSRQLAIEAYAAVLPIIQKLRGENQSLRNIAMELNQRSIPTRRGSKWTAVQVKRILDRADKSMVD